MLSPAERNRARRFYFRQDRNAYSAAHALARIALSSCDASVAPGAWVFEKTAHGRPEVSPATGVPGLRFNISHSRRVVACIVTAESDCGVDVESTHPCYDHHDLARAVLAPAELARITAAPDSERPILFCRYWTLKEAYAKALGLGMSLAFERIAFELEEGIARLQDHSEEWYFEHWSPIPTHTVAIAIRSREPVHLIRHLGLPEKDPDFSAAS